MKKEYKLTQEGIDKLKEELEHLKSHRVEIAEKLRVAREYGDLSENAEYHEARDQQSQLETRVKEIESILKNVELIDSPKLKGIVELGNEVTLTGDGGKQQFTIVGSVEANPAENKISDESPIGQALLGKKLGESVSITLPSGERKYTIESVS